MASSIPGRRRLIHVFIPSVWGGMDVLTLCHVSRLHRQVFLFPKMRVLFRGHTPQKRQLSSKVLSDTGVILLLLPLGLSPGWLSPLSKCSWGNRSVFAALCLLFLLRSSVPDGQGPRSSHVRRLQPHARSR